MSTWSMRRFGDDDVEVVFCGKRIVVNGWNATAAAYPLAMAA